MDTSSDSSHISTRIAFSGCCLQSSQIWCWCHFFHFKVFLEPTCHGISTTWYGVYHISVIAHFTRWVSSRWLYLLEPPLTLESPCESSNSFFNWKGTWSYHTLSSFRYPNHDLDKHTLAYFGPIALPCLSMATSDLKDTHHNASKLSHDP
jgi:hypothetical protein